MYNININICNSDKGYIENFSDYLQDLIPIQAQQVLNNVTQTATEAVKQAKGDQAPPVIVPDDREQILWLKLDSIDTFFDAGIFSYSRFIQ